MGEIEYLLVLLTAAAVLVRVADLIAVPYPIALVLGGLAIGFIPGLPDIELEPEVVFLVFLPPLLHSAAWRASPQELRAEVRPLALLAVGLVLATTAAVAVVAHAMVPGMSWAAAFVLGAVVAPTDPVAAIATFSRVGVPERVKTLVEGESMINDATALTIFRVAVAAAVTGSFAAGSALLDFFVAAVGGILVGLAAGWLSVVVIRRQSDRSLAIVFTLLTAYGSYIAAEELGVSGVLGAVVSGLYASWHSHTTFDADTRLTAWSFWQILVFALEALLFVLLGLQFAGTIDELGGLSATELLVDGLVISLVVAGVRMAWVLLPYAGYGDLRERLAIGWSGLRGAISLAAALAVPLAVPERPQIIVLTFAVILATLIGQGLSLPVVLRALGLKRERVWSPDEALARLEAAQSALDRVDELEDEGASEEQVRRLRELYRARFRKCVAVLGGDVDGGGPDPRMSSSALRRETIRAERGALIELRDSGRLKLDVQRVIERDLDLEEARLRT